MPNCSVPYCLNTSGKDARLTFHPFPHETPLFLKKWLENIGRPNWHPGHRSVVCSAHFEKDDFNRQGRLRFGSFPVKFPEPPFRKKIKVETSPGLGEKSVTVCLNPGSLLKPTTSALQPVGKQAPSTIKKFFKLSEPTQRVISVENDSLPVEAASEPKNDSVSSESVSNENRIEMNHDETNASVSKIPEASSKRKVLEESQPTATTPTVALGNSYSLRGCRICGSINGDNVDIFGKEGVQLSLEELLKKCHLKVSESESLPLSVCRQCIPRLKTTHELMTTWEKTKSSLGVDENKRNVEEPDPPVIHSKPIQPQPASRNNRRVLLLEMGLREGIPVKEMIAQAIQELTLRLKPKDIRESKPEGRIMFLDLQGGKDAFPEQMKKAIAMLFPSGEKKVPTTQKKIVTTVLPRETTPTVSGAPTPTKGAQGAQSNVSTPATSSGSSPTVTQAMHIKGSSSNPSATSTPIRPKQVVQNNVAARSTSLLVKQGVPAKVASQTTPSPSAATSAPPALRPLPLKAVGIVTGGVPQIIQMPSLNFLNIPSGSATVNTSKDEAMAQPDFDDHDYEDSPAEFDSSSQGGNSNVPPLVPIKLDSATKEKSPVVAKSGLPVINISKMRESVVSKINQVPSQFNLVKGDKIVGIVLRNSENLADVHKKLQATFSAKIPACKDKPKERPILPKGDVSIVGFESISTGDAEGGKKAKPKVLDIASAVDSPAECFDRRNARRLSLSFMWQKSGFLVSSYQKLFTWRVGTSENAMPILTCRVCNFSPKSRQEVEGHLSTHPDLQCPICSKYFLKDTKVFEHMSVIHGTPQPASYVAKRKPPISWRVNGVKRPPLRQYQCSRCEKRFKVKDSLQRHLTACKERACPPERVIGVMSPDTCAVCSRTFTSQEALQEHMLTHVKRTSWLCDICGLVLKSASNYRTHIARHDELAHEYQYQCHICKKRFKLTNRFQDHMKKHEVQQKFICSSCGKSFTTLSGLRQHEILHGERKLQCKFCPSRFHRRDHLRIHEGSHLKPKPARTSDGRIIPGTGRMFTCRFCVSNTNSIVRFPNMRELMKHYSDDHAYERGSIPATKKYECDRCNKSFVNTTLLRHHHMWHAGLRPYNCSFCGAGFMIKERLRNHELTHTNERPYKCPTCGKGFRSRHVLKQHKVIHNDPSEFYKCQYCDKTFSRIDNLRTHTRVHTGEKPWKCLQCQRQFRLRSECTKHIQIAHQIPLEEVGASIETLLDPLSAVSSESETAIAAIAGITTVRDMELLIEGDDIEECDEDEDSLQ